MPTTEIFEEMAKSIIEFEEKRALELAHKAVDEGINLLEVIEKGFGEGIKKVGALFSEGELFLPELMVSAQIMQEVIKFLDPHLKKGGDERKTLGKVVIATIEGDIHSIGKTLVGTMLKANGFEVYDLGADVPIDKIIEAAIRKEADIIGVSALLTTTMIGQKKLVEKLKEKGLKEKFKVIIGGSPVTSRWTADCGADGYAENAIESVSLAKSLITN